MERTVWFHFTDTPYEQAVRKGFLESSENWQETVKSNQLITSATTNQSIENTKYLFKVILFSNGCKCDIGPLYKKYPDEFIESYGDENTIIVQQSNKDTFYIKDMMIDNPSFPTKSKSIAFLLEENKVSSSDPEQFGHTLGVQLGALLDAEQEVDV